jgi:uncharacterized RDD family membrane protein YckC
MASNAYPNLLRRYLGAVVDWIVIVLIVVSIGQLPFLSRDTHGFGTTLLLLVLLNYEPVLTRFLCTAGQAVMRFRVREIDSGSPPPIWRLYVRVVVKASLGLISFLTLPARADRRAIHDLAANTLVVEASGVK